MSLNRVSQYLLLFIFYGITVDATAEEPFVKWVKAVPNINSPGGPHTAVGPIGEVYTLGGFSGTVDFGAGTEVLELSAEVSNIYIQKLDESGSLRWVQSFGGPNPTFPIGIAVSDEGNVHVLANMGFSGGGSLVVYKLDQTGSVLWSWSSGADSAIDRNFGNLILDGEENVYATGTFQASVNDDIYPGRLRRDAFVLKLGSDGVLDWFKTFGGDDEDHGREITLDNADGVYVLGSFEDVVDFDPGDGVTELSSSGGDTFVSKFDTSGTFVWAKSIGGEGGFVRGHGIAFDGASLFVAGVFGGVVDFDPGPQTLFIASGGTNDAFVQKLSTTGDLEWVRAFGGSNGTGVTGMAIGPGKEVYTTGGFNGVVDFDPGEDTETINARSTDIFVSRLDNSGNFDWVYTAGADLSSIGASLAVDGHGVYVSGRFSGIMDFAPDLEGFTRFGGDFGHFALRLKGGRQTDTGLLVAPGEIVFLDSTDLAIADEIEGDTFVWEQIGGPTVALQAREDSSRLQFQAPFLEPDQVQITVALRLTINDASGETRSELVLIHVVAQDSAITRRLIPLETSQDGLTFTATVSPIDIIQTLGLKGQSPVAPIEIYAATVEPPCAMIDTDSVAVFPAGPETQISMAIPILFDSSSSMGGNDPQRLRVAGGQRFLQGIRDIDRVAVLDFGVSIDPSFQATRLIQGFTNDVSDLETAISRVAAIGGTPMWTSIIDTVGFATSDPASFGLKPVLVLFADGRPNDTGAEQALSSLSANRFTAISVGLGEASENSSSSTAEAVSVMKQIAERTSGAYIGLTSAQQSERVFGEISDSLFAEQQEIRFALEEPSCPCENVTVTLHTSHGVFEIEGMIPCDLDDHGDTSETATSFPSLSEMNSFLPGVLQDSGDVDVFAFDASAGVSIDITVSSDLPVRVELVSSDGTTVLDANDALPPPNEMVGGFTRMFEFPGTYYVRVSHALGAEEQTGAYTITIRELPTDIFELSLSIAPSDGVGFVEITPPGNGINAVMYTAQTTVQLTAVPTASEGYRFSTWSGDIGEAVPLSPSIEVVMDQDRNIVAEFIRDTWELTFSTEPTSSGEVNVLQPPNADGAYIDGTTVTLTATADEGFFFVGWSGDLAGADPQDSSIEVIMISDRELTASFAPDDTWQLTITRTPSEGGNVDVVPPSPTGFYEDGTGVEIVAMANPGYRFAGFTGDFVGGGPSALITMIRDIVIEAQFVKTWVLDVNRSPENGGTVVINPASGPGNTYDNGSTIELRAVPNPNFSFGSWSGAATGSNSTLVLTLDGNANITANFVGEEPVELDGVRMTLLSEFDTLDINDDGAVSFVEALVGIPDLAPGDFAILDSNGNGNLSETELSTIGEGEGDGEPQGPTCAGGPGELRGMNGSMGDLLLLALVVLSLVVASRKWRCGEVPVRQL